MDKKRSWLTVQPKYATKIELPHPLIQGPIGEGGSECPWPWDPEQLINVPLGQYHCPYCLSMCMAGLPHPDWKENDGYGNIEYFKM